MIYEHIYVTDSNFSFCLIPKVEHSITTLWIYESGTETAVAALEGESYIITEDCAQLCLLTYAKA